jgi:B9 domain-containing protein 1
MTEHDNMYAKFNVISGQDWTLVSGSDEGITQQSKKPPIYASNVNHLVNVWNFPLEFAFKSTNAFGWPQLVLSVYGPDLFGRDVVRGYGSVHLPRTPGRFFSAFSLLVGIFYLFRCLSRLPPRPSMNC